MTHPNLSLTSWIYLFAKFTPEALLFEALLIFVLLSGYTAFWILKKRKYGPIDNALPSGPVREYLNELIDNAETLRSQLFGLLAAGDPRTKEPRLFPMESPLSEPTEKPDKGLMKKLKSMESKMADQANSMEKMLEEKKKLEESLKEAKNAAKAAASATSKGGPEVDEEAVKKNKDLEKKVAQLEARLGEYNVIEDDLANLKRLQQENAKLKSLLQEKGVSVADVAPPAAAAPTPEPAPAAPEPAPAPQEVSAAPAAPASGDNLFDGLVNQVEESLQPAAAPAAEAEAPASPAADLAAALESELGAPASGAQADAAPSAAPAAPAEGEPDTSTSAPAEATMGTDDDALVAEFEKMLKG